MGNPRVLLNRVGCDCRNGVYNCTSLAKRNIYYQGPFPASYSCQSKSEYMLQWVNLGVGFPRVRIFLVSGTTFYLQQAAVPR